MLEGLDILLAGEEDEDVARADGHVGVQLHHGAERGVHEVVLRLRRVEHLNRVLAARHVDARERRIEEALEERRVERRRHGDDPQRAAARALRAPHQPAEDVGLQRALVRLRASAHVEREQGRGARGRAARGGAPPLVM